MDEKHLSPLEVYINKVFKFLIVILPSIALCAGLTFTVLHLLGYYPDVSTATITIFDCTCVLYTCIGFLFNRNCKDAHGKLKPYILKKGKRFMALLMLVQWNFISYMIPSRDFWAYSFFFVLLSAFFLSWKSVAITALEIVISMHVSWIISPDTLLPVRDALFLPNMALRGVLIVLGFSAIGILTYTVETQFARELEKISDIDTLTLLYNRRKLYKVFDETIAEKDTGSRISIIMSDIDDFKMVNDSYGHSCGDKVLQNVAGIMRGIAQGKGIVFRYGGEEMLVLVHGDLEEAVFIAEIMRKKIAEHSVIYDDKIVSVTMTMGVAEYADAESLPDLIKRADTNLYYGKKHGKNCVFKM